MLNQMRRVLLISFDFPPRGATGVLRVTKFARYLPQFGWQPVVLTAAGLSVVRDDALLGELPPDLEVIRVADPLTRLRRTSNGSPAPVRRAGQQPAHRSRLTALRGGARRLLIPDPQITWLPSAVHAASVRLRRGDIAAIVTTSPPHSMQLAGLWLKRRFPHIPWIIDLRDLWSEGGTITDPLLHKLNLACERACVRAADQVVVVTDTMRQRMRRDLDLSDEQIVTITNGYDRDDIVPAPPPSNAALRIVYVGTITATRTPSARGLFAALERLAAGGMGAETVQLHGYGLFDLQVHAWAAPLVARGMVHLHGFVPHAQAMNATAGADVLLVVVSDDLEGRIAMPNKLYEYVAVGTPILALSPPGEATRLIDELGAGIALVPSDVDGIEAALKQFITQHRAGTLPRLAPNDVRVQRFERRALTHQLAALLDRVTA